jgi:hypothetical protein
MPRPKPGMIYKRNGEHYLFVRTEQRPGASEPEDLYVLARGGVIFTHWSAQPLDDAELIIDSEGRRQAQQQAWNTWFAEQEVALLAALLKKACEWLPAERAKDLRTEYVNKRIEVTHG